MKTYEDALILYFKLKHIARKAYIILVLISSGVLANAQKSDSTMHFFGNLYHAESYKPIEYAHIINLNNNEATISDTLGNFHIRMQMGDTLMITSIGYKHNYYQYSGPRDPVVFQNIPMQEKVYKIAEVQVTPFGTYNEFKRRFLDLDLETDKEKVHPLLWEGLPERPESLEPQEPGIMSPISMIYNIFSEEAREKQKYKELLKKKSKEERIKAKFNREKVSELTGLEGSKLERFMDFCNFTDPYLLTTREYFILERVKKKYRQFQKLDSLNLINP